MVYKKEKLSLKSNISQGVIYWLRSTLDMNPCVEKLHNSPNLADKHHTVSQISGCVASLWCKTICY